MNWILVTVGSVSALVLMAYIGLGISFCGMPYKCPEHGWTGGGICFECDDKCDDKCSSNNADIDKVNNDETQTKKVDDDDAEIPYMEIEPEY